MVSAADESFASSGREAHLDSERPFPRALLPDTTCPEAALAKSNRELRMLIDCKRSLARAQDEPQLLTEICRILVGPGGYRLAWFGFADREPDYGVRIVAHAGHDSGYLERLRVSWRGDERGQGPTGRAIRERRAAGMPAIDTDPHFLPWREAAHREGYGSSVALPLLLESECIGALSIYAAPPRRLRPVGARAPYGARRRIWRSVCNALHARAECTGNASSWIAWRRSYACTAASTPR